MRPVAQRAIGAHHAVAAAFERDRRHGDRRPVAQPLLDHVAGRVAGHEAVAHTVGMHHDVDEVRVVERRGGSVIGGVVEAPLGRPESPQQSAQRLPVQGQASATPLAVEVVLVPQALLVLGRRRCHRAGHVVHVVAATGDQTGHAPRPQGRDDAGRTAAPVVAGKHGLRDLQHVQQRQQVHRQRRLLARAWRRRRQEARGAVAAQPGHDHAAAGGHQRRHHRVERTHVVGEAVQQHDRRAVQRAMLLEGHAQHAGIDVVDRHERSAPSSARAISMRPNWP